MSNLGLEAIVNELCADSAAIMIPNDSERHLDCFDSLNMPPEWVAIKNPYDEKVPSGNVSVYNTGKPLTRNHLQKMLEGFYIESVMIIPIKRGQITIGMLEIIHDKDNKIFSDDDQNKAIEFSKQLEPLLP